MIITIYSTKTCPYCKMEKEYLTKRGIKFINYFADEDPARAQEMIDKSGQMGVPVTIIKDDKGKEEIVVGFERNRLDKIIGIR